MKINHPFIKGYLAGAKEFSENITSLINTFLLVIVYLLGIGLTSLVARIVGKHFLDIKMDKKHKTYWQDLQIKDRPIEKYFRQF